MLPVRRTLSVVLTFQCNAQCDQCGTLSSPQVSDSLDEARLATCISEARSLGFECVVFTGGEATLRWHSLLRLTSFATEEGMSVRLVTNAVWATSPQKAVKKLAALQSVGLKEINYSTGDQHQRFVPVENIIHAIAAAEELGISHHTMVETRAGNSFRKQDLISRLPPLEQEKLSTRCRESPWMPMSPHSKYEYDPGVPVATRDTVSAFLGCESILATYVLYPDGTVSSCCGLGSRSIKELHVANFKKSTKALTDAIDNAEEDLLKLALHFYGPVQILEWLSQDGVQFDWEGKYAHRCQACVRLYSSKELKLALAKMLEKRKTDLAFALLVSSGAMLGRASRRLPGSAV